jgi:peptide-methionine (S)-S-oxide reductase
LGALSLVAAAGMLQMVTAQPKAVKVRSLAATPKTSIQIPARREVATLAAGCFWSMEAMFKQLKGVDKVVPGYAGGHVKNPTYEQVCAKKTGHTEAIQVTYDPKVISYRELLQVQLIATDPTTLNRQGPDEGPEYRSVIFAQNAEQAKVARQAIKEVDASRVWRSKIVTLVEPFTNFYAAEKYHVNYYNLHPNEPYCAGYIAPKIAHFRQVFKAKLKQ